MRTNYAKELFYLALIFILTIFFLVLFCGSSYLLQCLMSINGSKYYLISYVIILIISYYISKKIKHKLVQALFLIISFPISYFFILFIFAFPFITLLLHLLYYVAFCIILPLLIFVSHKKGILGKNVSEELIVYVTFTLGVSIATVFNKQIKNLVHLLSPARIKTSKKLKPYNIEGLSDYLLSESNVKFTVFTLYLIFIILVNCFNFQNLGFFSNVQVDKAVLQSFASYLALDRVLSNLRQLEFKPSEMFSKLLKSISNKIDERLNQ